MNPTTDDETAGTGDEDMANFMSCFAILASPSRTNRRTYKINWNLKKSNFHFLLVEYHSNDPTTSSNNPAALSRLTPGAYSNLPTTHKTNSIEDSLSLDISQLRQQYKKLKERNKQVQIMIQSMDFLFCMFLEKEKFDWMYLAASNEQKQRSRALSIHPSATNSSENFRRPTISSSLEFSTPKLPSSVCSIAGGPLVNELHVQTFSQ